MVTTLGHLIGGEQASRLSDVRCSVDITQKNSPVCTALSKHFLPQSCIRRYILTNLDFDTFRYTGSSVILTLENELLRQRKKSEVTGGAVRP